MTENLSDKTIPGIRTLFIEPFSGIAGDMTLAALIGAGADFNEIKRQLRGIPFHEEWDIVLSPVSKKGISALHVEVRVMPAAHHHARHGRTFSEIKELIENTATMSPKAKENAIGVFSRLAEAEARVHGKTVEDVHFHEVGALDAIVDICGVAIAVEMLDISKVFSMPPPLGTGKIQSAHGILPVPAPATMELMKGFPVAASSVEAELTTPTGAAIISYFTDEWNKQPSGILLACGIGAGTRDFDTVPNILRISIFEEFSQCGKTGEDKVAVLECNLDDINPENFSWIGNLLLENGALDYAIIPFTGKKSRPGFILQALCLPDEIAKFADILLKETTTLGVRHRIEERKILSREINKVLTPYGEISVKIARDEFGNPIRIKPEADDCALAAKKNGQPYTVVYEAALKVAKEQI